MISRRGQLCAFLALSAALHLATLVYARSVKVDQPLESLSPAFLRVASVRLDRPHPMPEVAFHQNKAFVFDEPHPPAEPQESEPAEPPEEPPPPAKPAPPVERPTPPEPEAAPEPEPRVKAISAVSKEDVGQNVPVVDAARGTAANTDDGLLDPRAPRADKDDAKHLASVGGTGTNADASGGAGYAGVDHATLNQQYGRLIITRIDRAKTYPVLARKIGLEGRLMIEITVSRAGEVLSVKIRESSGHEMLDQNALATVRELGQLPPPPRELSWAQKTFVLPVRYKLQ